MQLIDYLNVHCVSNHLQDYKHTRIETECLDLSDSDKDTLTMIEDIVGLKENYKQKDDIFEQFRSLRLPDINTIKREDLLPLLSLDINAMPLPIRARLTDFLWTTIKDPNSAKIAIDSYLELYGLLWDEDDWLDCVDAIYRAVNISCRLNKKGREYRNCIESVKRGLGRTKGYDKWYLTVSLLELLAEQGIKKDEDILKYSRNAIEEAKKANNFAKAQAILEALSRMDPGNNIRYYEEIGDIILALSNSPAIRRVHMLKEALQYYHKAHAEEKQLKCRTLLEEAQSHILEEMQEIETDPVDITSTVKEVQKVLRKVENFKQAVLILGAFVHIYKREELFQFVREEGRFASLFPSIRVDQNGRQLYLLPPLDLDNNTCINDASVQLHMFDKARAMQEINSEIILKLAYSEMNKKYQYNEEDLDFLVSDNAIIPKGRERIIRKGLFLGLQGDIYSALHILLPQTESIVRHLVELCGGKTFYYSPEGDVSNYSLGSLLEDHELNDCYDPDMLFCIAGLLDKKEGANLRNEIAHGILNPGNRPIDLYFLGFLIKFLSWYNVECWNEKQKMNKRMEEQSE